MCIGGSTPDVPKIPERQAQKLPDNGSTAANADLAAKRRRGLYASILTSAQGAPGTANTTAKTTLG